MSAKVSKLSGMKYGTALDQTPHQKAEGNSAKDADAMDFALPLSWQRTAIASPEWTSWRLPVLGMRWLALGKVPRDWTSPQVLAAVVGMGRRLVLRGCSPAWALALRQAGFSAVPVGVEAILERKGQHFGRATIRSLVRRGLRHGQVYEANMDRGHGQNGTKTQHLAPWLKTLYAASKYAKRPPLSGLFCPIDDPSLRWFALGATLHQPQKTRTGLYNSNQNLINANEMLSCNSAGDSPHEPIIWAAVGLSQQSDTAWHVERLLRRTDAPVGVMEAVLAHAFAVVCAEGAERLSLGEAPFVRPTVEAEGLVAHENKRLAGLIRWVGRRLGYAYNAEGLFRFKAKFRPVLRPVYVCARPRVSVAVLAGLFWQSGVGRLALRRLWPW